MANHLLAQLIYQRKSRTVTRICIGRIDGRCCLLNVFVTLSVETPGDRVVERLRAAGGLGRKFQVARRLVMWLTT